MRAGAFFLVSSVCADPTGCVYSSTRWQNRSCRHQRLMSRPSRCPRLPGWTRHSPYLSVSFPRPTSWVVGGYDLWCVTAAAACDLHDGSTRQVDIAQARHLVDLAEVAADYPCVASSAVVAGHAQLVLRPFVGLVPTLSPSTFQVLKLSSLLTWVAAAWTMVRYFCLACAIQNTQWRFLIFVGAAGLLQAILFQDTREIIQISMVRVLCTTSARKVA
eukprot:COSAG01_NODE_13054_length_1643_cov_1.937176_1_plen_217_part_00